MNKKYFLQPYELCERFNVTISAFYGDEEDSYATLTRNYSREEFEEYMDEYLLRMVKYHGHSNGLESLDDDTYYYMGLPYNRHERCHTIESVEINYINEDDQIFNVELNLGVDTDE